MGINEIIQILIDLLKEKSLINIEINKSMFDKKLLGQPFCLGARELVCLYLEVENKFNITLPQNEIVMGKFGTLNSIANIVSNEISDGNSNAQLAT